MSRPAVRAFTLLEIVAAVAVVALIAVGLAGIFGSIGDTVAAGQRVRALNEYAAMVEARMREDFSRMAPDGFLVIRQEQLRDSSGPLQIALSPDDASDPDGDGNPGRPRRADEIAFFVRAPAGESYTSARRPLSPELTPRSSEARVYYGFGERWPRATVAFDPYYIPQINADTPNSTLAAFRLGGDAVPENRFASNWHLLRHVTVLAGNPNSAQRLPSTLLGFPTADVEAALGGRARLQDSDRQIGLMPALDGVFLESERIRPADEAGLLRRFALPATPYYRVASGLLDVATTSIAETRAVVNSFVRTPGGPIANSNGSPVLNTVRNDPEQVLLGIDSSIPPPRVWMHQWMVWMLPSFVQSSQQMGARIRYEPHPTRMFIGSEVGSGFADHTDSNAHPILDVFDRAIFEADQEMLSAHNFVPRCTEFIVEWSYGYTVQTAGDPQFGELIWYGLDRRAPNGHRLGVEYDEGDPRSVPPTRAGDRRGNLPAGHPDYAPPRELVNPVNNLGNYPPNVRIFAFGQFDPEADLDGTAGSLTGPGPWPWPKLIRVTMSIADPTDPELESTFQATFEVPQRPAY